MRRVPVPGPRQRLNSPPEPFRQARPDRVQEKKERETGRVRARALVCRGDPLVEQTLEIRGEFGAKCRGVGNEREPVQPPRHRFVPGRRRWERAAAT